MFSGIIKHTGVITKGLYGRRDGFISIESNEVPKLTYVGGSVAVNGVCLTVVEKTENSLSFFVSYETSERTTLSQLEEGTIVNLELPATPSTFLDGHIVLGHVDTVGKIATIEKVEGSYKLTVSIPKQFIRYVVYKGSVAIDGISLTVYELDDDNSTFSIAVIPSTYEMTNIKQLKVGNPVNVEFDVIGKYVERFFLLGRNPLTDGSKNSLLDKLKEFMDY